MAYNRKLLYTKTVPSWNTPGGSLGSFNQTGSPITPIQLSSSNDPESEITYTVTSGSLPNGFTLSASGEISGTLTGYSANQDVLFTIRATDAEGEFEERDFIMSIGGFPFDIDYLIVAGGGGGGEDGTWGTGGGGGGAGGFISSSITGVVPNSSTVYTITVGSGGPGVFNNQSGANGQDSSISGVATAIGGGGGGGYNNRPGKNGGSGGGSGNYDATFGLGTSGQGNNGSGSLLTNGGGGAGAAAASKNGGIGATISIISAAVATAHSIGEVSGSDVYFSGGGGGTTGVGGLGGGANGCTTNPSCTSNAAISAPPNTGGGGGTSVRYGTNGGAGGSGIVILRMPTGTYSGNTTGSPIVEVDGSETILIYTGSGTYTV